LHKTKKNLGHCRAIKQLALATITKITTGVAHW
jgi:hypothetical protein